MNLFSKLNLKGRRGEILAAYIQIVIGCVIGGAAYPMFLTPNSIAPGGLTGVATILNYVMGVPVGMTSMLMNIPLFLIGYKAMGRRFVLRSLVAMVLFSFSIDLIQLPPMTTDPLLATLFGGLLLGLGLGLIFRGGATTGGTDMVARIVHNKMPVMSVGMFLMLIDCCVVVAAGLVMGSNEALYALISIFVSSKVIDMVIAGFSANKACFIMTSQWEEVSQRILTGVERGVTQLTARGAYSRAERPVVLCVASRQEIAQIKEIVHEEDEHAFMFITDAHEALGEGFSNLGGKD